MEEDEIVFTYDENNYFLLFMGALVKSQFMK